MRKEYDWVGLMMEEICGGVVRGFGRWRVWEFIVENSVGVVGRGIGNVYVMQEH